MNRLRVLILSEKSTDIAAWNKEVTCTFNYDFYHLADYHLLAHKKNEGEPVLLAFREGEYLIALPLLLRPVAQVEGLEFSNCWDATSVYGYAGPIFSHYDVPDSVIKEFQEEIKQYLHERKVVAVFSRLHPLCAQERIVGKLGDIIEAGMTVSIDLTLSPEQQRAKYIKMHKHHINRLRRSSWRCINCQGLDCEGELLDEFTSIYRETMERVRAEEYYYFDKEYFEQLLQISGAEMWIFAAKLVDNIGAAGIFSLCNGIVQYHLGGTRAVFLKNSPIKLVFDEVRLWAIERGARVFHLGGGVGGKQDSLFAFKAGFSDCRNRFLLWKWVVDEEKYDELCAQKREWNKSHRLLPAAQNFFPEYRTPVAESGDS